MGAPHSDRGRVAELESGYLENNRGYGTTSEYDSREHETRTFAELKDHRDTDNVPS